MLDRQLWVALSKPLADRDAIAARLPEHLDFMIGLEREGILFGSGPFLGGAFGEGMTILRAATADDARAILDRDPFVVAGLRTYELREWLLKEGAITVTLHASDQRGSLP